MTETINSETTPQTLLSVDEIKPSEEGGPNARAGFNYQDEIAVSFLIEMLETPSLLKVHCETHDDVLLLCVVEGSAARLVEFVQVKANEQDGLWSIAVLCARKNGKIGTSILEISLARDMYIEESRFRLVTFRPVVNDLKILTFPRGAPGRETHGEHFNTLKSELDRRFPGLTSTKGNGTAYWIENCFWDVRHSEDAVRNANLLRLIQLSSREARPLLPEQAEVILGELRAWAKAAGDAKWEPNRDIKIITRNRLHEWWKKRTRELTDGASNSAGGKLREKMIKAGLTNDLIELAIDMRRDYAALRGRRTIWRMMKKSACRDE